MRASLSGLGLSVAAIECLQAEADYLAQEAIHRYAGHEAWPASPDSLALAYAAYAPPPCAIFSARPPTPLPWPTAPD